MPAGIANQCGRREFQYNFCGAGKSRSPKQLADTHTMPGSASSRLNTVVPQVGQKLQSCQRPDCDDRRQRVAGPFTATADSEKNAEYENALPLPRWQSWHEHA